MGEWDSRHFMAPPWRTRTASRSWRKPLLGVPYFDTAEIYAGKNKAGEDRHNEALVGHFLKKVGRDKVTFATKFKSTSRVPPPRSRNAARVLFAQSCWRRSTASAWTQWTCTTCTGYLDWPRSRAACRLARNSLRRAKSSTWDCRRRHLRRFVRHTQ